MLTPPSDYLESEFKIVSAISSRLESAEAILRDCLEIRGICRETMVGADQIAQHISVIERLMADAPGIAPAFKPRAASLGDWLMYFDHMVAQAARRQSSEVLQ